jgi:branched-chain amino acid transport system substrate-binding protein
MTKLISAMLLMLCIITACQPTGNVAHETKHITIGAILPLSGDFAALGIEAQRGIELAKVDLEQQGYNVEIIYEDDESLSTKAIVDAAHKLTAIDHVDIALTLVLEEAHPCTPIFNEARTPLIVLWDSNKQLQEAGPYIFGTGFSTEKSGEIMADYAYNELDLRRVAVIQHVDIAADIIAKSFEKRFEENGGTIVYKDSLAIAETDYRTNIAKALAKKPDGIYFPLIPPTTVNFLEQLHASDFQGVKLSVDSLILDVITAAGSAAEGTYFTNIYADNAEELEQQYKATYGEPVDIAIVSFGYNGLQTAVNASNAPSVQEGLLRDIGPTRSRERIEHILHVENGVPVAVQ